MNKNYQCILFDADETLFHFDSQKTLQSLLDSLGISVNSLDFDCFRQQNQRLWKLYQQGLISMSELRERRFAPWCARTGLTVSELSQRFCQVSLETSELISGAYELIATLSPKVRLGLLTNGFHEMQAPRLAKHAMVDHFDFIITSEDVGYPKPHRPMFDYALEKLGQVSPQSVLMVGDTLEADVLGGNNVGIDTCWFNPRRKATHSSIRPTYQVSCLHELRQRLEQD